MKAFFHRLHIGGGNHPKEKDHTPPREKLQLGSLPSWPPQDSSSHHHRQPTTTPISVSSYKPLPELDSFQLAVDRPLPPIQDGSESSRTLTPTQSILHPLPSTPLQEHPAHPSSSLRHPLPDSAHAPRASTSKKPSVSTASVTSGSDVHKKVAFIATPPAQPPQPSNSNSNSTIRAAQEQQYHSPQSAASPCPAPPSPPAVPGPELSTASTSHSTAPPVKSSVSRFHATHAATKEPRGSTSINPSSSRVDVSAATTKPVKATSVRAVSPYAQSSQSLRSGTPYSSMSNNTSGSRILAASSWSEVTEDDLVSNLGSRERTRQEVLFEIISSEERYVNELVKMKDTFIDPLLHPYSSHAVSPVSSSPYPENDFYRSESPVPTSSTDHLPPIAARFMSPTPSSLHEPSPSSKSINNAPIMDGDSLTTDDDEELADGLGKSYSKRTGAMSQASKHNHPRSPYRATAMKATKSAGPVPFPSRSHHSLPPPPRNAMNESTQSLGRQSAAVERHPSQGAKSTTPKSQQNPQHSSSQPSRASGAGQAVLRKFKKSESSPGAVLGDAVAPQQLPEDLRACLEVIDGGVFDGHKRLQEALRKRYDEQYPLVRSLADVFVSNSDIFAGYAKYVLHLERALEQAHEALHCDLRKAKGKSDNGEYLKVCKLIQRLEAEAYDKGETGLAITLSKPFQRLLKYPLLFQNLLFHTDPSTYEYESTLQMVAEVEAIVRSIQDEKIQKEDRDKTRDVFARIEGLDKVTQVALPKPSRVLVEERPYLTAAGQSTPPPARDNPKNVRGKASFKRLSDVLSPNGGVGGKKDLWLVVFNDVVLQCQRTGTTTLPLVAVTNSRVNSLPDLQGKVKYATTGRRSGQTKPRNLYKFIKIETWDIANVVQAREGVVSMEDITRTRSQLHQPKVVPLPDDDDEEREIDSDDSDKKSKMSFSYWGADKITVQKPVGHKARLSAGGVARKGAASPSYGRESSANAKFGSRLVSADLSPSQRPTSRRTHNTVTATRTRTTDESVRSTVTRPQWNSNGNGRMVVTSTPLKRSRNTSQNSGATASTRTPIQGMASASVKSLGSPAPSEDSGVGLYRQMLAKDPSLHH